MAFTPSSSTTFPLYKPYSAIRVTVPNDGVPHQLFALMLAIDPNANPRCKYFTIQNDASSAANCLMGEKATDDQNKTNPAALTATMYGVRLAPLDSETFGGFWDEYNNIARFWVLNDGTGTGVLRLAVQAIRG
jgi:hypothetical protein